MDAIRRVNVFIIIGLTFLLHTVALAKDINFEATVDRNKVGLGQTLQLELTFDGTQNMPALELPAIEGFQARYLGPSTRMSIINGQASSSITHVYTLLPVKKGTFKIGPFKFEHNGDKYSSNSINLEVAEEAKLSEDKPSQEGQLETKDLNERIFLRMQVGKDKVYLNEVLPVTIKLFVNRLGVRDIQYPQFSHDGFSIGEFGQPRQYQETLGGINYDIIEFNTTIFGLEPGEFRLGPANLQCNLIVKKQNRRQAPASSEDFFNSDVFDNFFGGYQTYPLSLKSADIPITILPLPEENKPAGFSGALGFFDFEATVNPLEVKVGDPVTLKATVRGQGNFNTVNLSTVSLGNDFKAYEPQVKQEKETKTFEQVLIPLNTNIKEIPAISFSFFNTRTGQYETITRGPFPVKIVRPEKEEGLKVVESKQPAVPSLKEEKLGKDIIYIKDNPGELRKKGDYLYKNKIFLGFQVIPLLVYLFIVVVHARNRKLKTDIKYARQFLAPRKARVGIRRANSYLEKGSVQEFYDTLFETLQEYLGDKFHLPSKGITISVIDEQLKNRGISEEILAKLKDIFLECDMVRYAASQLTKENMQNSLKKLEEAIDYLQRDKV
ncbi:MAG: BatD family protein [Candidatus Omnitrophica bacterium]|nr:BatD family protein [Candidatus Omnitrophota bacterium]